MKRIAIFCDGTWSKADQPDPTNVVRLSRLIPAAAPDGTRQVTCYFEGVGVPGDGGFLKRLDHKLSGGAMGFGLDDRIAEAYEALARAYHPGDQVHVFGFSRGAYTARSLAGLIRNSGLPRDPSPALIRECFDRYRARGEDAKPDAPESLEFRLRHSPHITTSSEEDRFRQARGAGGHPFRIAYMGVWDTVGALGIPAHWGLPAHWLNRKYRFHDTDLSSMVESARHGVALDERRRNFVPTLWLNLPELRKTNPAGSYCQQWFAGVHGSVGGGGDIVDLSSIAMLWIADGAAAAGLSLDKEGLNGIRELARPLGSLASRSGRPSLASRLLALSQKDRAGPEDAADLAHPAVARYRTTSFPSEWNNRPYRPRSLRRLDPDIMRIDLASLTDYTQPFA